MRTLKPLSEELRNFMFLQKIGTHTYFVDYFFQGNLTQQVFVGFKKMSHSNKACMQKKKIYIA